MTTRPDVIQEVHRLAFDAIASQRLPEDITDHEQAEGLISLAMAVLRRSLAADQARAACISMVEQQKAVETLP